MKDCYARSHGSPGAPTRGERLCAQTLAEIKQRTLDQIAKDGAEALSLSGVAWAMGMSGPAPYRYFASRDDLLATLVAKAWNRRSSPRGVRVNAVSPGPVRTPFWTADGAMGDALASGAGVDRATVLDRIVPDTMGLTTGAMVEADEVADLVALLASPRARSTTGVDHVIDSGFLKNS